MTDDFLERTEAAVKRLAAAAWREGFIAAHNMDRGYGLDFAHPVSRGLWDDIDVWNPHTGNGTTDPYADDEEDD